MLNGIGSDVILKKYLRLFRIHHYLKNFLIFLPIIFSGNLFDLQRFGICVLGFVVFNLVASSIYVINDIRDVEADRRHPVKKFRPLARGEIKKSEAIFSVALLLFLSLLFSLMMMPWVDRILYMFISLYGYLVINIMYSLSLKNVPILDILLLASGFVIRVLYGGFISNIRVSNWLFLTIFSLALFMIFGKRRNEIEFNKKNVRNVLKYYNKDFLDKNMYMFLATSLVFYALWCFNGGLYIDDNNLIWSIPLMYFIVIRYSLDVERKESLGDPVDILINDKILIGGVLIYGLVMVLLLYV